MTFDIGLHEVCALVGERAGVCYVITKFSRLDSLPNFVTHGAPLTRESSAIIIFISYDGRPGAPGTVSSFLQRNKFRYQVQNHKAVLYESSRDYVTEIRA